MAIVSIFNFFSQDRRGEAGRPKRRRPKRHQWKGEKPS